MRQEPWKYPAHYKCILVEASTLEHHANFHHIENQENLIYMVFALYLRNLEATHTIKFFTFPNFLSRMPL